MASDLNDKFFQQQPRTNWSLERGYSQSPKENPYPVNVFNTGRLSALFVVSRIFNYDIDSLCADSIQGLKVTFQVRIFSHLTIPIHSRSYVFLNFRHHMSNLNCGKGNIICSFGIVIDG